MEDADIGQRAVLEALQDRTLSARHLVHFRKWEDQHPAILAHRRDVVAVDWHAEPGLFAHRDVRDVFSLMRAITAPGSSEDLYAVLASPTYGIDGEDLTALCDLASRRRRSLWSVLGEVIDQPGVLRLSAEGRRRLAACATGLRASIVAAHQRSAPAVLYDHLRDSGWLAGLGLAVANPKAYLAIGAVYAQSTLLAGNSGGI